LLGLYNLNFNFIFMILKREKSESWRACRERGIEVWSRGRAPRPLAQSYELLSFLVISATRFPRARAISKSSGVGTSSFLEPATVEEP
jgi:hypothetical protein